MRPTATFIRHKLKLAHCGERHFVGALGVDYRVITSADELH
jgi:hypothetical protein